MVQNINITVSEENFEDYICITDIAKGLFYFNFDKPDAGKRKSVFETYRLSSRERQDLEVTGNEKGISPRHRASCLPGHCFAGAWMIR